MDGRRSEMRRTMTLSEQLATPDLAIRDFLNVPQDDADAGPHEGGGGMINWKPLRDRLRLRRAANAWRTPSAPKASGAVATPATATNINRSNKYNNSPGEAAAAFSRAPSLRFALQLHTGRPQPLSLQVETPRRRLQTPHRGSRGRSRREEEDEGEEQDKEEAPAAQMSLMALLQQTDSWDDDGDEESGGGAQKNGGGTAGDDDDCEGQEEEEEMVHVCCVCMVRHKGAAFIPCGHTFCRLCSRELWVSRGNCPLCNGFIQEVLDIF